MDENDKPLRLHIGGVLRCCIETYNRRAPAAADTNEGDTLPCDHCSSRLTVQNGYWRWGRDYTLGRDAQ